MTDLQYTFTNKQYRERHKTILRTTQKIHRTTTTRKSVGRAPSLRVLPWHLPYNWGKSTEKPSVRVFPCFFLSCKANARVKPDLCTETVKVIPNIPRLPYMGDRSVVRQDITVWYPLLQEPLLSLSSIVNCRETSFPGLNCTQHKKNWISLYRPLFR